MFPTLVDRTELKIRLWCKPQTATTAHTRFVYTCLPQ